MNRKQSQMQGARLKQLKQENKELKERLEVLERERNDLRDLLKGMARNITQALK